MEVSDDPEIDSEEGNDRNYDCEEDPAVSDVVLDVVAVHPEVSWFVSRLILVRPAVVEGVPQLHDQHIVILLPLNFCLEELWEVDNNTETEDGEDVVPGLPVLRRQVKGVADPQEPLDGDCHRHEDGPTEADVGDGVDYVREADRVGVVVDLKGLEGVVDPPDNDVGCIEASQSHQ